MWSTDQDAFLEAMADAASSVVDYFDGNMVFVNVMMNMSVDCDCCAVAEDPCMDDIGILVSLDPIAIDQACLDLVYVSNDPGREHFVERVESRNGIHTVEAPEGLGFGTWQTPDGETAIASVKAAVANGYRHIDVAAVYGNEIGVGKGIAECGIDRKSLLLPARYGTPREAMKRQWPPLKKRSPTLGLTIWIFT